MLQIHRLVFFTFSVYYCIFCVLIAACSLLYRLSAVLQCESIQPMLESLGDQQGLVQPPLRELEQDVEGLKEWASGHSEKRAQLQSSMSALREAVGQIQERTSAITKDLANKVCPGLHSHCRTMRSKLIVVTWVELKKKKMTLILSVHEPTFVYVDDI